MERRQFLKMGTALAVLPVAACTTDSGGSFEVSRSETEWRDLLDDREFRIMREMGTERPFSSPLDKVTAAGTYHCKGCDQALYASDTKFDSGTGWPSFYRAMDGATATKPDPSFLGVQTEVHCNRCGSHLGHIFDDGPPPTGKRHCINGVCMVFLPEDGGAPIVG